jgi:hypothetical protein
MLQHQNLSFLQRPQKKCFFSRNFVNEHKMSRCISRYFFKIFKYFKICFLVMGAPTPVSQSGFPRTGRLHSGTRLASHGSDKHSAIQRDRGEGTENTTHQMLRHTITPWVERVEVDTSRRADYPQAEVTSRHRCDLASRERITVEHHTISGFPNCSEDGEDGWQGYS